MPDAMKPDQADLGVPAPMTQQRFKKLGKIWDAWDADSQCENEKVTDAFDYEFLNGWAICELLNEAEAAIKARDILRRHVRCASGNCAHWNDLRKVLTEYERG